MAVGERVEGPIFSGLMDGGWTGMAPPGSSAGQPAAPGSPAQVKRALLTLDQAVRDYITNARLGLAP